MKLTLDSDSFGHTVELVCDYTGLNYEVVLFLRLISAARSCLDSEVPIK